MPAINILLAGGSNLNLRQWIGQNLFTLSLRAVRAKQSNKFVDCHAARRALAARNDMHHVDR